MSCGLLIERVYGAKVILPHLGTFLVHLGAILANLGAFFQYFSPFLAIF